MPDNFMGHAPVTHKLDGDVKVFQDGLMATLDDMPATNLAALVSVILSSDL